MSPIEALRVIRKMTEKSQAWTNYARIFKIADDAIRVSESTLNEEAKELSPTMPEKLMCKWDWIKLPLAERKSVMHCRCYGDCHKRKEEKEDRMEQARGFWQRLWVRISP